MSVSSYNTSNNNKINNFQSSNRKPLGKVTVSPLANSFSLIEYSPYLRFLIMDKYNTEYYFPIKKGNIKSCCTTVYLKVRPAKL